MRPKTVIILVLTMLLIILMLQSIYGDNFTIALNGIPKTEMIPAIAVLAFVLGLFLGRPTRVKKIEGDFPGRDQGNSGTNTLSDEDRDYIS